MHDRIHSRMRVLRIVYRVVVLGARRLHIEVHVRRYVLGHEEPPCGVHHTHQLDLMQNEKWFLSL